MENILNIIRTYIQIENTDYALLIDGEWGCGKTYNFRNLISPELEKLKSNSDENYKVIYVSLNGLSSVNSISSEILSSSIGINEKGKFAKALYSSLGLVIGGVSRNLKIEDYVNDIEKIDFAKLLDYKNKILCFDDIERINSKLQIDEVLGYINTNFVEHSNIKVLIIGDTSKINEKNVFKEKSEKLIGRQIEFKYTFSQIFEIILKKYEANKGLKSLFANHKQLLVNLFEDYSLTNLRTIFFSQN